MKLSLVGAYCLLAFSTAACFKSDAGGGILAADSVAGMRYINLVPDTGAVDFRVVDVVGNAPNAEQATFRSGGLVYGVPNNGFLPVYTAVAAGTRQIRVFMNGGTPTVSSTILLDTTFTFVSGQNYTFFLYGYSRTGATPKIQALITQDVIPTIGATQFAVRVVDLANTLAPTFGAATPDVFVDTLPAATTPVGVANATTAAFTNVNLLEVRPYSLLTARPAAAGPPAVTNLDYRVAFAATGTKTPFLTVNLPTGTVGTSTTNPLPGNRVAGTAMTVVLVPRSVAGSQAPQTAAFLAPAALVLIDRLPPRTAP
jgi:hypothetical protein